MAQLTVWTFAAYLAPGQGQWPPNVSDSSYNALKFIKALKPNKEIRGYANIPVLGRVRHLTEANRDDALVWAGELVADFLKTLRGTVVIVPIPSRTSLTPDAVRGCRTFRVASEAAQRLEDGHAEPLLWWKEEWASARDGGTRDAELRRSNLNVGRLRYAYHNMVLLDDVIATGGNLRAGDAALRGYGYEPEDFAIAIGRTVHDQDAEPFAIKAWDPPLERL